MYLKNKKVLITGGTGTFGKEFVKQALAHEVKKIYVFSRDELKQSEMQKFYKDEDRISFLIGDIRDYNRLKRAFTDINIVVHAAAQKQVPSCEYNPYEAIRTNIIGAQNIIEAAIDTKVKRVIFISTDKAVNPVNLYGATKLCMEKLAISGASYVGSKDVRISVVRYGNVIGSRGSVINVFKEAKKTGKIPITDNRMTRFWLTVDQGVEFVLTALKYMKGGEIFIPKIPSMRVVELAEAIAPECKIDMIGIRQGEKLHETLISNEESRNVLNCGEFFIIKPVFDWLNYEVPFADFSEVDGDFSYSSDNNTERLSVSEMENILNG
ncbi:MAG: UDP-N-acetylglucosamine 4,6-dehydratase (inverting) [Clostridiales bacterium]